MSNTYPNGLALYVLTSAEPVFGEKETVVVMAPSAHDARTLAREAVRRAVPRPEYRDEEGDRWLDPARTTCKREPAGHAHTVAIALRR